MEPLIATSSAVIVKEAALSQFFALTGIVFWGFIALIGVLTVANKAYKGFFPKKIKSIK